MREMFGSAFVSQYGQKPNATWMAIVDQLTDAEIVAGMNAVSRQAREYPPNATQFRELCRPPRQNRPVHLRYEPNENPQALLEDTGRRERAMQARNKWIPKLRKALKGGSH